MTITIEANSRLQASGTVQVQTTKGYVKFSKDELQEFLDHPKDFHNADNLPKWLERAFTGGAKLNRSRSVEKSVKDTIQKMIDGKIKKLDFVRDQHGNIIGIKREDTKTSVTAAGVNFSNLEKVGCDPRVIALLKSLSTKLRLDEATVLENGLQIRVRSRDFGKVGIQSISPHYFTPADLLVLAKFAAKASVIDKNKIDFELVLTVDSGKPTCFLYFAFY